LGGCGVQSERREERRPNCEEGVDKEKVQSRMIKGLGEALLVKKTAAALGRPNSGPAGQPGQKKSHI